MANPVIKSRLAFISLMIAFCKMVGERYVVFVLGIVFVVMKPLAEPFFFVGELGVRAEEYFRVVSGGGKNFGESTHARVRVAVVQSSLGVAFYSDHESEHSLDGWGSNAVCVRVECSVSDKFAQVRGSLAVFFDTHVVCPSAQRFDGKQDNVRFFV